MPHSWLYYEKTKKAVNALREAGLVEPKDELMVRGIIQIAFEEP